jgi:hypothetical protein
VTVDIRMNAQVRKLLGAEGIRQVTTVTLADGHCPFCGNGLPANGPVNVVVVQTGNLTQAAYAHIGCADSGVVALPAELAAVAWPDELDMTVSMGIVRHGPIGLPTVIAELPKSRAYAASGSDQLGELTDLMASLLLERGFSLIGRVREVPDPAEGWTVAIQPETGDAAAMQITAPDGGIFYEGSAYPPAEWRTLAEQHGWCVVYAASTPLAGEDAELELRVAAHRGELVGARVAVAFE